MAPQLTAGTLVELIDFELSRLASEDSSSGWTGKALLGALAGLTWILFGQIDKSDFTISNVLYFSLVLIVALDFLDMLKNVIAPSLSVADGKLRYKLASVELGHRRLGMIFYGCRNIALLWCIHATLFQLNLTAAITVRLWLWSGICISIFGLVVSSFNIPFSQPYKQKKKGQLLRSGALIVFLAVATVSTTIGAISPGTSVKVADVRVAVIAVALVVLAQMLTNLQRPTHLLFALATLRYRLSLGEIDVESARNQLELFMLGKDYAVDIQNRIGPILIHLQRAQSLFQSAHRLARECREKMEEAEASGHVVEAAQYSPYLTVLRVTVRQCSNEVKEGERQFELLANSTRLLLAFGADGAAEVTRKLKDGMREIRLDIEARQEVLTNDLDEINRKIPAATE